MQALLEYEKHKRETGELQLSGSVPLSTRVEKEVGHSFFILVLIESAFFLVPDYGLSVFTSIVCDVQ